MPDSGGFTGGLGAAAQGATSGKMNAPPPPDYMGLANQQAQQQNGYLQQQTQANRPDQSNPYSTSTWTQGPDGQWSQSSQFTGPMGDLNQSLQQQAAQSMGSPLNFGGLPGLSNGEDARNQAISSAYGQATSRLDPMFSQREDSLKTQLVNQGLQPGTEAYNRELNRFGQERNDAYSSAMNGAIGQGTAAGSALFNQSLQGRQQAMEEMLRQREQPLQELGAMRGFLGQQGFNSAGMGQAANLLTAGGMQDASNMGRYQLQQQQLSDMLGSGMQLGGTLASFLPFLLSDERAKTDVQPLGFEVLPGVRAVSFRYHPEAGLGTKRHVGVLAQEVRRVMPGAVRERPDGLLEVHPAFAPHPLE